MALGVSPQQIQDALYSAYGTRQVSTIFTPANQYAVIVEIAAGISAHAQRPLETLRALFARAAGAARLRW